MPRASRKRPFERRDGLLWDKCRGADGRTGVTMLPAFMVGEAVAPRDRPARRAEIGGDDVVPAARAMDALGDERRPEMLEQLLVALAKRNTAAPSRLTSYADDPRV